MKIISNTYWLLLTGRWGKGFPYFAPFNLPKSLMRVDTIVLSVWQMRKRKQKAMELSAQGFPAGLSPALPFSLISTRKEGAWGFSVHCEVESILPVCLEERRC